MGEHARRKQPVSEEQIAALNALPKFLLISMRWEVYVPVLDKHPMFRRLIITHDATMEAVTHKATTQEFLGFADELFGYDRPARRMLFMVDGQCAYAVGGNVNVASLCDPSCTADLPLVEWEGDAWICEAALWVKWKH